MRVTGCGAVGNHRHRQIGGVGGIVLHLDVEHGGEPAEALRSDAEGIDLVIEFQAQLFGASLGAAGFQILNVDRLHERFLGDQHCFFRSAANAEGDDSGRAPAAAHGGHGLQHPLDDGVGWIEHGELGLGFRAAALGGNNHVDLVARNDGDVDHGWSVVVRVLARLPAGSASTEARSLFSGSR